MNVKSWKVLLLFWCVFSGKALGNTMDDFPVPPRTQVWWMTNGNVHNGHEVFIKKFKSDQPPSDIVEFYKNAWQRKSERPGYVENHTEGWQLISRLVPEYQWVVQIRASDSGRGSEGLLSVMKLNSSGTSSYGARQSQFTETVRGGDLLSSTEASEPVLARTQLHLYPDRPSRVAKLFKSHMTSIGWSLQNEFGHKGTLTQSFEKSMRKIDVALVEHGDMKTLLFLNEVIINDN